MFFKLVMIGKPVSRATMGVHRATTSQPLATTGVHQATVQRLPWLIICLLNGLAAAGIVTHFEGTVHSMVDLAVFMPALIGMGGNAGTQTLGVTVRLLALNQVRVRYIFLHVLREAAIGFLLGLANGLLVGIIAWMWKDSLILGLIVGLAMWITLIIGTSVGVFFPMASKYLGFDPAVASGPFITTTVDIFGVFIYLYLANILLQIFH